MTQEQIDKLFSDFNKAGKDLNTIQVNTQQVENRYGKAYQKLVRAGLMPQIKKKYRKDVK